MITNAERQKKWREKHKNEVRYSLSQYETLRNTATELERELKLRRMMLDILKGESEDTYYELKAEAIRRLKT